MIKLYHYLHCPFCIRVELALGYLKIPFTSQVLAYDDEETPKKLSGKKMLPIADIDGNIVNESLDIIYRLDKDNKFSIASVVQTNEFQDFKKLLDLIAEQVYMLAMPHVIHTEEFSESAAKYFQEKKEEKRGSFKKLISNKKKYLNELKQLLSITQVQLRPFYNSAEFSIYDICLVSQLWMLYIVPDYEFTKEMQEYMTRVSSLSSYQNRVILKQP